MKKQGSRNYLKDYLIGIYDDNNYDELIAVLENISQVADFFGITTNAARNMVFNKFHKIVSNKIVHKQKTLSIYFIRIDEE